MQAVAQLDEDDADVLGHGEEHLAQVLRLHPVPRRRSVRADVQRQLVELGHAVDEPRDFVAEPLVQDLVGDAAVFLHVVQQRRRERVPVQFEARDEVGDGERVGDVRVAGLAHLALVALGGEFVGVLDGWPRRLGGEVLGSAGEHGIERRRPAATGSSMS